MAERNALSRLWLRLVSLFYEPPPEDDVIDPPRASEPVRTVPPPELAEKTGPLHMLRSARGDYGGMPVVLARPRNMEDATTVAERVKDRVPVIMNLEGVDDATARRVVDFIGGVVFALDGSLRKSGRAVFVCTPSDIPVEELRTQQPPRRTTLFDTFTTDEAQQVAL
jgi:cell division inhibitor SepF